MNDGKSRITPIIHNLEMKLGAELKALGDIH